MTAPDRPGTRIRPIAPEDAPALLSLITENDRFLAPFLPAAPPGHLNLDHQVERIAVALRAHAAGELMPYVILADAPGSSATDGVLIGRITLSNITRGVFQSCTVGYWVAERHNGQGHAGRALAQVLAVAFDDLDLHRVEAGTLVDNQASQRVLARNGFTQYGLAPRYLKIAGRWQDHVLFQRLNEPHGSRAD